MVNCYLSFMMSAVFSRLSAVVLILALAIGPAGSGMLMSSMTGKMATISLSDTQPMGPCKDCGGSKNGVPVGACSMHCTGMAAVSPELTSVGDVPAGKQEYRTRPVLAGRYFPPDPYPPRSIVLS